MRVAADRTLLGERRLAAAEQARCSGARSVATHGGEQLTAGLGLPAPHPGWRARAGTAAVALVWLITIVLMVSAALSQLPAMSDPSTALAVMAALFATVAAVTAGAVLALRVPHNPIGWLMLGGGFLLSASFGTPGLPLPDPAEIWLAWLSQLGWVPAVVCLGILVPLLFPTGHLPSPRWRALVVAAVVATVLACLYNAFGPAPLSIGAAPPVPNPLTIPAAADLLTAMNGISNLLGIIAFPFVVYSVIQRYRHAVGVERQQLKWFAAAGSLAGLGFVVAISTNFFSGPLINVISSIAWPVALFGFGLIPVAVGVAVLRYRLYDIDVILRRTAVYVPLTAILAGVYAASIVVLQKLFIAITGNPSDGAVILSTLILATVFTPVKTALQNWVDRSFRDVRDAERRLDEFVDAVADSLYVPAPDRVLRGFLHVVVGVTHATGGAAYVGPAATERVVAQTANRIPGMTTVVDVGTGTDRVGRLVLDSRTNGTPLRPHDLVLVAASADRLAQAVGPEIEVERVPVRGHVTVPAGILDAAD
jgi:hypothetical protein